MLSEKLQVRQARQIYKTFYKYISDRREKKFTHCTQAGIVMIME